jgi:hypothetical protein
MEKAQDGAQQVAEALHSAAEKALSKVQELEKAKVKIQELERRVQDLETEKLQWQNQMWKVKE